MPKIDRSALPVRSGSGIPEPYASQLGGIHTQSLGNRTGLTQFGVNHVTLDPGAMSSQRHWHVHQDEFVIVTEGALTLIDDHGETPLAPGDCCAFPAGDANGHHIVNRSDAPGSFVVVGTRTEIETAYYADIDMMVQFADRKFTFTRKDGTPIPDESA